MLLFQITAFADVHSLTIPEVFEEDAGSYMVQAVNSSGHATCLSRLNVLPMLCESFDKETLLEKEHISQQPPEFKKLFQDVTAKPGDSVVFEAVITGSPKPRVCSYVLIFFEGNVRSVIVFQCTIVIA